MRSTKQLQDQDRIGGGSNTSEKYGQIGNHFRRGENKKIFELQPGELLRYDFLQVAVESSHKFPTVSVPDTHGHADKVLRFFVKVSSL